MPTDTAGCTADTVRCAVMLLVAGLVLLLHTRSGSVPAVLAGLAAGALLEDFRAALHGSNPGLYRRLFVGSLEPCGDAAVVGAVLVPLWFGVVAAVLGAVYLRGCTAGRAAAAVRVGGGALLVALGAAMAARSVPRMRCRAARGAVEAGVVCHPALVAACYVLLGVPLAWLVACALWAARGGAKGQAPPPETESPAERAV